MVSVIIPCYNAKNYIRETVDSILEQDVSEMEIIIVDDGSTDGSGEIIKAINDGRVVYTYQKNKGVSNARNTGLKKANGKYVVFFDADDKMSPGFLCKRIAALESDLNYGFSSGPVVSFPLNEKQYVGVSDNVAEALLTYKTEYHSCPSNYLIRKSVLMEHNILFNENLFSTADRYFLIELANITKGKVVSEAPLYYRISDNSMSNHFTKKLVADNETFFLELKHHRLIPEKVKKEFNFRIHYILGSGFLKTGDYFKGLRYALYAFFYNPQQFLRQFFQRFK